MIYKMNKEKPLTPSLIQKYIERDIGENARKIKLGEYYEGRPDILHRVFDDSSKPNNRVASPFPSYITDISVGYFLGEPITYTSNDDEMLAELTAINTMNRESSVNSENGANASIYGVGYEITYLDEEAGLRFKDVNPIGCIPIFHATIDLELLYFIRYYDDEDIENNKMTRYVEVYTNSEIIYYKDGIGQLNEYDRKSHPFGMVPVSVFFNNKEGIGDFERVMSLIDAYNVMESDSINEQDYFSDAYLILKGMMGTDSDDIADMKENRVLLLPDEGEASWLIKNLSDGYVETEKERLEKNIFNLSLCPNMTDENFAGNSSGVAMRYKLMGIENTTSKKERCFKVGLAHRLKLIERYLNLMGSSFDANAITPVFTRNIPANLVELTDIVTKLKGIVSDETLMSILPLDLDYEEEKEKMKAEEESSYSIQFDEVVIEDEEEE